MVRQLAGRQTPGHAASLQTTYDQPQAASEPPQVSISSQASKPRLRVPEVSCTLSLSRSWPRKPLGLKFSLLGAGPTTHTNPEPKTTQQSGDQAPSPASAWIWGMFTKPVCSSADGCTKASFLLLPSHFDMALPWGQSSSQDLGKPSRPLLGEAKRTIKKCNLQTHAQLT